MNPNILYTDREYLFCVKIVMWQRLVLLPPQLRLTILNMLSTEEDRAMFTTELII